ncbi:hypothetical protein CHS0354_010027 [Potamilus streckersoni]|uniref:Uncharacterized protein n=1 Tax=Potamilus streckersoni TaxID=2493646 RepID=A0AAE0SCG5_9BIVA|nr:hypothetical protein CHS0354_010027 [Potamilus streckersoni]
MYVKKQTTEHKWKKTIFAARHKIQQEFPNYCKTNYEKQIEKIASEMHYCRLKLTDNVHKLFLTRFIETERLVSFLCTLRFEVEAYKGQVKRVPSVNFNP